MPEQWRCVDPSPRSSITKDVCVFAHAEKLRVRNLLNIIVILVLPHLLSEVLIYQPAFRIKHHNIFVYLFVLGHGSEIFGDGDVSPGHEFAVPQFPPGLQPALQGQGAQHTISTRQTSAQVTRHLTPVCLSVCECIIAERRGLLQHCV